MLHRKLNERRRVLKRGVASLAAIFGLDSLAKTANALTVNQGLVIVQAARSKIGTPYKLPPAGFPLNTDCSLLTQWSYSRAGLLVPRTASQQFGACRFSTNASGSLVFFDTINPRPMTVTHVGINLGNGWMVDANSAVGKVVEEMWLNSTYWRPRFIAAASL